MTKREEIFSTFKSKSCVKQEVHAKTKEAFGLVKEVLQEIAKDYKEYLESLDNRVLISYKDEGEYGAVLGFGGDLLVFQMHSNVFSFEESNPIHKHSYITEKESRTFCGVINVYNFLADSFKYNRQNDLGFLVSRIFVNEESHLFVEGKKELGYRYADLSSQLVSKELLIEIIESSIQYALEFDLYTPDFDKSQLVSVGQMKKLSHDQKVVTSKRLGFKMSADRDRLTK
tara:strand:- start:131388 stop:132074 length:687 start_codon:yes stop_codon:yes gene_type:complete